MSRKLALLGAPLVVAAVACGYSSVEHVDTAGQYVLNPSGTVRCWVTPTGEGAGTAGPGVTCKATGSMSPQAGQWQTLGFLQAPVAHNGSRFQDATVDAAGDFSFQAGNEVGAGGSDDDLVLAYGKTYKVQGWTIWADTHGTQFTNDATGHGMFVSIENVYAF